MGSFSERLKILRQEKGLSQNGLSVKLNMPRTTLSSWEAGSRTPDLATIQLLADFFNISIDYLVGRIDVRNPLHTDNITNNIFMMLKDDPELSDFIEKLFNRHDLQLISKQIKDLPESSIIRLIRVLRAIEVNSPIE
jgi:transcriptional regulator with XRE-family HTH domain